MKVVILLIQMVHVFHAFTIAEFALAPCKPSAYHVDLDFIYLKMGLAYLAHSIASLATIKAALLAELDFI